MLLIRLWNFLKGYVIIIVEGNFLEKFINICIHRQIFLWNIKRIKSKTMTLNVSVEGFKKIRPVCRKTKCRARIVDKKGLPFIINRYRKRKAFVAGAFIFVIIIYVLTSFIWAVEITGNETVETAEIQAQLSALGVKPGVLKYTIDTDKIADSIMMGTNNLAWVGIFIRGTKIRVEVVERKPAPALIPREIPCDIVAARDSVIKSIVTKEGKARVKEGDTVTKGQVLISGKVDSPVEGIETRYVHALGEVIGRTWYEETREVERYITERIRTGKVVNKYSMLFFNNKINLFLNKTSFENYDKIDIVRKLSLGENAVLPFGIVIERYYEVKLNEKELDKEEAKQLAANYAYDALLRRIPVETKIINSNVLLRETQDGRLFVDVIVECEENIGIEKELGGM